MEGVSVMCLEAKEISDSKPPTVSIGMPIFNDEKYASKALDDLLAQTFEDFELIISDNGSTDRTEEICKRYAAKDRRIRYFRQSRNLGAQANFVFLLHHARSDFFMWAASDDRWDSDFVSILLDALRRDESFVSAFCPFKYIDEDDRTLGGTQRFDFSDRNTIKRISRFSFTSDEGRDAFFYGLHRRQLIKDVKFPVWWGINAKVLMNSVYPVLTLFLARGRFIQAGTKPLWSNRLHIHSKPRHSADLDDHPLVGYLAFLLRKVNVFYESARSIYQGTGSVPITIATTPVLAVRCIYDCLQHSLFLCCVVVNHIFR
jgi:glycosyltransferase involved in cell wall biosynthesis